MATTMPTCSRTEPLCEITIIILLNVHLTEASGLLPDRQHALSRPAMDDVGAVWDGCFNLFDGDGEGRMFSDSSRSFTDDSPSDVLSATSSSDTGSDVISIEYDATWKQLCQLPTPSSLNLSDSSSHLTSRVLALRHIQQTDPRRLAITAGVHPHQLDTVSKPLLTSCIEALCTLYNVSQSELLDTRAEDHPRGIPPCAWGDCACPIQTSPILGLAACSSSRYGEYLLPETLFLITQPLPRIMCDRPDVTLVEDGDTIDSGVDSSPIEEEANEISREGLPVGHMCVSLFRLANQTGNKPWRHTTILLRELISVMLPPGNARYKRVDRRKHGCVDADWVERLCDLKMSVYLALTEVGGVNNSASQRLSDATDSMNKYMLDILSRIGDHVCEITKVGVPLRLPHDQDEHSQMYFVKVANSEDAMLLCYNNTLQFVLPLCIPELVHISATTPLKKVLLECDPPPPSRQTNHARWIRDNLRGMTAQESDSTYNRLPHLINKHPDHWIAKLCGFFVHRTNPHNLAKEVQAAIHATHPIAACTPDKSMGRTVIRRKMLREAEVLLNMDNLDNTLTVTTKPSAAYLNQITRQEIYVPPFPPARELSQASSTRSEGLMMRDLRATSKKRKLNAGNPGVRSFDRDVVNVSALQHRDSSMCAALQSMAFKAVVHELLYAESSVWGGSQIF